MSGQEQEQDPERYLYVLLDNILTALAFELISSLAYIKVLTDKWIQQTCKMVSLID